MIAILAMILGQAIVRTTFTIYGSLVTTSSLLKRTSFPLHCLMLFTLMQAKLYFELT